jgi:hypothetical protein
MGELPVSGARDPSQRPRHHHKSADDEPVLPDVTGDERDEGWGDEAHGRRDEEWYRRERPPHHE